MSLDTATPDAEASEVLRVTDEALTKVLEVRAGEDDPSELALRIEITGTSGPEYTYDLAFEPIAESEDDNHRQDIGELTVLVPADSVERLTGATLDLPSVPGQAGLVIRNPNRPDPMADVGELTLEGDAPDKIQQLLDASINPSLAAHGGFASLLGVDGETAYMTMGGGCQGCSMSQETMVQGISTAIREAIPEITEVVDATDHTAGQNPFYT